MLLYYIQQTFKLLLLAVVLLFSLRTFVIEPGQVNGRSMEPTFFDSDFFIVDKITLLFREPYRGEFVQFQPPIGTYLAIKRVVGLPGEQVAIKKDGVYIRKDGAEEWVKLDEPYLADNIVTQGAGGESEITYLKIPEYSYFLIGDNRSMSGDSRAYGSVHRSTIFGLAKKVPLLSQ